VTLTIGVSSNIAIYTYPFPTITPHYCLPGATYELEKLKFDGTEVASGATLNYDGLNPPTLDLDQISIEEEITFKVRTIYVSDKHDDSPEVTINIVCPGAGVNTPTSSVTVFEYEIPHLSSDPDTRITFPSFCSLPGCCSYKISDSNIEGGNSWTASGIDPTVGEDSGSHFVSVDTSSI